MDFGAFVEVLPGKEGLVHMSELANYRVNQVEAEVGVGDAVPVKVLEIDDMGRVNLSKRIAEAELAGEDVTEMLAEKAKRGREGGGGRGGRGGGDRGGRGGRGGDRGRGGRGGDRGGRR